MLASRRGALPLTAILVLLATLLVTPSLAQDPGCGPFIPSDELEAGSIGSGLTMVAGDRPEEFRAEVLGVLDDGNGPGRNLVVVELTSATLDEVGGIWFGMSGSPVYLDGQLIGAVAFGFSFGPSRIGGLTAAEDLVELAGLPTSDRRALAGGRDVEVTGPLAERIAEREPRARDGRMTLSPLTLPLGVAGVRAERLELVQDWAAEEGLAAHTVPTGRAQFSTTTRVPDPGDTAVVGASYGDVALAATGTLTAVCDGVVVAFGHAFSAGGDVTLGIGEGETIAVVPDPTFGPFKLAGIGPVYGTVDHDRFTGVRGLLGVLPTPVGITSDVTSIDLGTSREGRTDIVEPEFLGFGTFLHILANIDSVTGRIGEGSADVAYTIQGTGAESGPFTLQRADAWADPFDIAFAPAGAVASTVDLLQLFQFEDVQISAVDVTAAVEESAARLLVTEVLVGVDGSEPTPVDPFTGIVVPTGAELDVVVALEGIDGLDAEQQLVLTLPVPDTGGFGSLQVGGGHLFGGVFPIPPSECQFVPELCQDQPETLEELITAIETAPRGDELVAQLSIFEEGAVPGEPGEPVVDVTEGAGEGRAAEPKQQPTPAPDDPSGSGPGAVTEQTSALLPEVVDGLLSFPVQVLGEGCPGCPPLVERIAGSNRFGTSVEIANAVFAGAAQTVVLAPGGEYAPALVAAPLARAQLAPVLLTSGASIPSEVADAILGMGASTAVLVATDGTYDASTEQALAELGITEVRHVGGADEFAVAANVAAELAAGRRGRQAAPTAFVVEGADPDPSRGWPDALAVSALAAQTGAPILLVESDRLPEATADAVRALGASAQVTVVGGPAAVSDAVAEELRGLGPESVDRVAGATRYETAVMLAQAAVALGANPLQTWAATGDAFADAIAAGSAVAVSGGVLVLVDSSDLDQSPPAAAWFDSLAFSGAHVRVLGGQLAISDHVVQQISERLAPGEPPTEAEPAGSSSSSGATMSE